MTVSFVLLCIVAGYVAAGVATGHVMYTHLRRIDTGDNAIDRAELRQILHQAGTTIARLALKAAFQWPRLIWIFVRPR